MFCYSHHHTNGFTWAVSKAECSGSTFCHNWGRGSATISFKFKAFNSSTCFLPFRGTSLSSSTGTIVHHFIFIQEQKGTTMRRYEWKFHFTRCLLLRGRRKDVIWFCKTSNCTHSLLVHILGKGKWETSRNLSLSWPCRFFPFYSKPFWEETVAKIIKKTQEH